MSLTPGFSTQPPDYHDVGLPATEIALMSIDSGHLVFLTAQV